MPDGAPGASLRVAVWRGGVDGKYQSFEVPRRASQTVLDVVTYIQRELDPTLAYRFACRVGMCGSCAMTVNGKARWTCRTHVSVVAEGVETLGQRDILLQLGCDELQGYFYGKPMPEAEISKRLAAQMATVLDEERVAAA